MNILDTFVFMFESDVSNVEKGAKAGDDAAKKLGKSLGDADKIAQDMVKSALQLAKNLTAAGAALLSLGAIKALVNDTAAHTAAVAMQARAMGVAVETVSAYQNAVVSMGGDAAQATETMSKLRDQFVEMSRFGVMMGPASFMFKQLGLSAQQMHDSIKDPTIALSVLAGTFEKLDKTQQLYIGKKLGLDQGSIMLLSQGKQYVDDYLRKQKELGVVTERQAELVMKYKMANAQLNISFETVKREIATALLPAFTWVVQGVEKIVTYLNTHKSAAVAFFVAIGTAVGVVLLPPLVTAAGAMWALIAPILAAAAPFIALGVAIGLVVDDIMNFIEGNDSLTGQILEKYPEIGQVMRSLADIGKLLWHGMIESMKLVADFVKTDLVPAFEWMWDKVRPIFEKLKQAWDWADGIAAKFSKPFEGSASGTTNFIDSVGHTLQGWFGGNYTDVNKQLPIKPGKSPTPGETATGAEIAAKLVASGMWTPQQAAGIAGSAIQESGGKSNAVNPTSGAYGLWQLLGQRKKDFEKFAGHPLEGSTLDEQIAFFNWETTHTERRAGDKIRAATTARDAALAHSKYYERPGAAEANDARRAQLAASIASGQQQLASTNTPLAMMSSQAINTANQRNTQVSIGPTQIVTQATDAKAIAATHAEHLKRAINSALDQHDDGIAG